jgi:hypothetical protein
VLAFVDGLVWAGMADVAIPLNKGCIRLDDFEGMCAVCWGGHGDVEVSGGSRRRLKKTEGVTEMGRRDWTETMICQSKCIRARRSYVFSRRACSSELT